MPSFSKRSKARLDTCSPAIRDVLNEVIKVIDFSILCGHRTEEEQNALYAKGRTKEGKIVTNAKWGQSNHNTYPSNAVDIAPYPIDWDDIDRFAKLASTVKRIALEQGVEIDWGGDWTNLKDYPHFELVQ